MSLRCRLMSCATSSHDQTCKADGKSVESVKGMVPGSGSTAGLRIDVSRVSSQGSNVLLALYVWVGVAPYLILGGLGTSLGVGFGATGQMNKGSMRGIWSTSSGCLGDEDDEDVEDDEDNDDHHNHTHNNDVTTVANLPDLDANMVNLLDIDSQALKAMDDKPTGFWHKARDDRPHQHYLPSCAQFCKA